MSHDQIVFRAAWARAILGLFALTLLPTMHPATRALWPAIVVYLAVVAGGQVMIRKNVGGNVRSIFGGWVDIALLTFLVHRVGSQGTVLVAIYLFAGMMNALVTPPRVAMSLAVSGAVAYTAVSTAEAMGWLAYAPDAIAWAHTGAPSLRNVLVASAMLSMLSLFSTSMVVHLMRVVRQREVELEQANVQLEEISQRDPLTQLYNRRYVFQRLQKEIGRIPAGHALTALMLDLDGFKRVNDESGHLRGDALLKEIAATLTKNARDTDVVGRYGGDEFIVLLVGTDAEKASAVAERIANAIREVGLRFDAKRPVTASVGLAMAEANEEVASVLRRADQNAYRAKQSGGNRVAA